MPLQQYLACKQCIISTSLASSAQPVPNWEFVERNFNYFAWLMCMKLCCSTYTLKVIVENPWNDVILLQFLMLHELLITLYLQLNALALIFSSAWLCQQSYCCGAGVRHPSIIHHHPSVICATSINSGFLKTAAWTQAKFDGKLPIHHISRLYSKGFCSYNFYPIWAKLYDKNR